jgi:hypothetical protein
MKSDHEEREAKPHVGARRTLGTAVMGLSSRDGQIQVMYRGWLEIRLSANSICIL